MKFYDKEQQPVELSGAIFDLDGTLLDSMPCWETVGTRYLEDQSIAITPDLPLRLKTMTLAESADFFREQFGVKQSPQQIIAHISAMIADDYRSHAPLKAGAREVLDRLYAAGIPMCIATATNEALVRLAVDRLDIGKYFAFIATCGGWNTSKNVPYIFHACAQKLGTAPAQTVVFEDSLHSIRTAERAGFPVIGIYDASAESETEQLQSLCCRYLSGWEQLTFL